MSIEDRLARIAASYAPDLRFLAVLRTAFGLWIIAHPIDVAWVHIVPPEFFHPRPGLFGSLSSPPSESILQLLTIAMLALAAMLIVGVWTLPVSLGLSAVLITVSGISYSYSKVDHFILFELAPVFLAAAGWGSKWSIDELRRRRRTPESESSMVHGRGMPILLYAMVIGWAMLSAAVPKVMGGWLDFERFASRGYLARDIAQNEKLGILGPWALKIQSPAFWKALDYGTVIAEGCLIITVFTPLLFRLWLLLLASFHVGVFLILGISFSDYIFVYAVFFSPGFVWIARRCRDVVSKLAPAFTQRE